MKRLQWKDIHYQLIEIDTAAPEAPRSHIMLIYTGGTLGMVRAKKDNTLVPFDFSQILDSIPELKLYNLKIDVVSFNQLIDSSNVQPAHWIALATLIEENYAQYDGFVIIHGTDTMAFSASALSFLLEGLNKPVIFTGAQLPIGDPRTDARENLISALEIASEKRQSKPKIREVAIYFNDLLLRGNRAKKVESNLFGAFESSNYPALASAGVSITYNETALMPYQHHTPLKVHKKMDSRIMVITLLPGMQQQFYEPIFYDKKVKGIILSTFGAGNSPTDKWIMKGIQKAIERGTLIYNVSQCLGGTVIQGRYETSKKLKEMGVISGWDITQEAAIVKMMYLLARYKTPKVQDLLAKPLRGEMSIF